MATKIKLIPIDLKKCCVGEGYVKTAKVCHDHPDIKIGKNYLAKIDGDFYAGQFSRQWYGWSFDAVYDAGIQLDKPGTNSSTWQKLWEIVRK